jgi:hypothetical protein
LFLCYSLLSVDFALYFNFLLFVYHRELRFMVQFQRKSFTFLMKKYLREEFIVYHMLMLGSILVPLFQHITDISLSLPRLLLLLNQQIVLFLKLVFLWFEQRMLGKIETLSSIWLVSVVHSCLDFQNNVWFILIT